jgi:predicted nucleotidyltransferase
MFARNYINVMKIIFKHKWGRFIFIRNLIVGWITHSLQDRDKSEIVLHVFVEFIIMAITFSYFSLQIQSMFLALVYSFFVSHTFMFIFDGQFYPYIHDSFKSMNNAGINEAVLYLSKVRSHYINSSSVSAVLVYGSFCRQEFRLRSDLDIRVIRRKGILNLLKSILIGFKLRYLSILKKLPTDLLIVDSLEFVRKQMRDDEKPVALVLKSDFPIPEIGLDFDDILKCPSIAMQFTSKRTD